MVATLSRSGTGFAVNDRRSYDAWGIVRTGASTGDPKGRYVANLGHVQDDESGLVYMRARYYEASSGRFVSEDPAMDGANWFGYCGNSPVARVDANGKSGQPLEAMFEKWINIGIFGFLYGSIKEGFSQYSKSNEIYSPARILMKGVSGVMLAALSAILLPAILATTMSGGIAGIAVGLFLALNMVLFVLLLDLAFDGLIDAIAPSREGP